MRLSSILYPLRCPICDGVIDPVHPAICPGCRRRIRYCTEPRCVRCGKMIPSDRDMLCGDCEKTVHVFVQGRAAWAYTGAAKESVLRYKFANRRMYAPFYAQEMMRCMGGWLFTRGADALIPIPVTEKKRRSRGYNQALLLAQPLSAYLGVPVREDLLMRREGFRQQKELSRQMRKVNLQRAFYTVPADEVPRTVILIDDIYTTGSTLDAAAMRLKEAGVVTIYTACLCVGES